MIRRPVPKLFVSSVLLFLFGLVVSRAQQSPTATLPQEDAYIAAAFHRLEASSPGMAWMVPPDLVIAQGRNERISVFSPSLGIRTAEYVSPVAKEKVEKLQKDYNMLCPPLPEGFEAHSYRIPDVFFEAFERAFYAPHSVPLVKALSLQRSPVPESWQPGILSRLSPGESNAKPLHSSFLVSVPGGRFSYSFHGLYDPDTSEMFLEAVLLHGPDGAVLAGRSWPVSQEEMCDGCAIPTFDFSLERHFGLLNGFSLPTLPYPLLLRDTSTVEGRALSLVTFDEAGAYREHREYEYVVTCVLGSPEQ